MDNMIEIVGGDTFYKEKEEIQIPEPRRRQRIAYMDEVAQHIYMLPEYYIPNVRRPNMLAPGAPPIDLTHIYLEILGR